MELKVLEKLNKLEAELAGILDELSVSSVKNDDENSVEDIESTIILVNRQKELEWEIAQEKKILNNDPKIKDALEYEIIQEHLRMLAIQYLPSWNTKNVVMH